MAFARALRSPVGTTLLVCVLAFAASLPMLAGFSGNELGAHAVMVGAALAAFIAVPLAVVVAIYKERLSAYGFRLPEKPLFALALALLVFIPHALVVFWFSGRTEFQDYYAVAGTSLTAVGALFALAYYTAEEFLFRGFFFFSLRSRGALLAYGANAAVFALFHVGKPVLEILFAGTSALLLCWLSDKTKSFLPAVFVHAAIAFLLAGLIYSS